MKSGLGEERLSRFRRHEHLAVSQEVQDKVYRLEAGWACRYHQLRDGRRQIIALFLPGDFCEPHWLLSRRAHHSIVALTDIEATQIPLGSLHSTTDEAVSQLLTATTETFERQSDWVVSLGRESATGRICSLFAELYRRLVQNGRAADPCTIPLTQQDIADVVGLTPVHVNRVLSSLRKRGLVQFRGKTLIIPKPSEIVGQADGVPMSDRRP